MEEVVNFYAELSSADIERSTIPTYLVANVTYNKSDQYAFLITMGGDVFFYKMSINSSTLKTPLWHCNINALVMKYYKVDINVIFKNILFSIQVLKNLRNYYKVQKNYI